MKVLNVVVSSTSEDGQIHLNIMAVLLDRESNVLNVAVSLTGEDGWIHLNIMAVLLDRDQCIKCGSILNK